MKKQQMQMLILVLIFAALCAVLLGVKQYNKIQAEKSEETEGEIVIDVDADDIVRFSYDYEGEIYTFEKEEDTWYYAEDHNRILLQYYTGSLVSGVAPLTAIQVLENVSDLGQYGLTEPQRTISFETATGSYILYVGDKNPVTASYYVCLPSESTVYVVDASDINRFNVTLDNFIDSSAEEAETEVSTEESAASEASAEASSES